MQIISIVIISLSVSILIYLILSESLEFYAAKSDRFRAYNKTQELEENMNQIKNSINKMSIKEVLNGNFFDKYNMYDIFVADLEGNIYEINRDGIGIFQDNNLQLGYYYVVKTNKDDKFSIILLKPDLNQMLEPFEILIGIFSIFLFLLILYYLSRKKIKYIQKINDGIENMAGGKLLQAIPVEGNNELADLAMSINSMAKSLWSRIEIDKEQDRKHNELITNISHDLRSPLTSLIGYLDVLIRHQLEDPVLTKKYLSIAYDKSKRLQDHIENLFTYSKLINKEYRFNFKKINIVPIIKRYIDETRYNLSLKGQYIVTDFQNDDFSVLVDIHQLLRVLENLFDNIVKYGKKNTPVEISLFNKDTKGFIEIKNQTEQDLSGSIDNIFDRYYTTEKKIPKISSGIGLSIVNEIIKHHKGSISVMFDSPYITFTISLDLL